MPYTCTTLRKKLDYRWEVIGKSPCNGGTVSDTLQRNRPRLLTRKPKRFKCRPRVVTLQTWFTSGVMLGSAAGGTEMDLTV